MAKVQLPLGSFVARGQIGKAFVYFPWKGIACVRMFVVPANPNTSGQQTQRGFFTSAVDEYHAAGYNELDLTAWRLLAAQATSPLTYFNVVVREHVDALVAGLTWNSLHGGVITNVVADCFDFEINCDEDNLAKLFFGTTPGYMPNEIIGSWLAGVWTFSVINLSPSTKYYFYVKNTAVGKKGRTGIYLQKTAPA